MASRSSKQDSRVPKYDQDMSMNHINSVYDNHIADKVKNIEKDVATALYDKSKKENDTVISKNYRDDKTFQSMLSGQSIPIEDFTHNNMEPFFGGTIKQNVDIDSTHNNILEKHTGANPGYMQPKQENVCFSDIKQNASTDVFNKKNSYEEEYQRMIKSSVKSNETPFDKVYVGPGLGRTFDSKPTQMGFQSNERDFITEKTIDDLRIASNPRVSYKGRTVDGQKGSSRGLPASVSKNRQTTFFENTPDRYLKTTGAIKKNKFRPCQIVKDTNRMNSVQVTGNIYKNIGNEQSSKLQPTKRNILQTFGVRNVDNEKIGNPSFDYGKQNILVYNNERDVTSTRTYEGNITSLIKSIVAPLQDAVRTTNKDFTTLNPREFGQMQYVHPDKQTLYDPNDIAKTTIKETFIHDTRTGNLASEHKHIVYDPDDVMKKTLKETLPDYENVINLTSYATKQTVHDPNDIAKTTIKETLEDNPHDGYIQSLEGAGGYETNIYQAPNTNKQFIADHEFMGTAPGNRQSHGYLVKDVQVEHTNKEFISDVEHFGNANSADKKQMSYQDIYNATINKVKETLSESRKPTKNNVKVVVGSDAIDVTSNKDDCERQSYRVAHNIQKIYDTPLNPTFVNLTHEKFDHCENNIDPSILQAFHQNPYTQSLNNAM
jgi:hypothetical protein